MEQLFIILKYSYNFYYPKLSDIDFTPIAALPTREALTPILATPRAMFAAPKPCSPGTKELAMPATVAAPLAIFPAFEPM